VFEGLGLLHFFRVSVYSRVVEQPSSLRLAASDRAKVFWMSSVLVRTEAESSGVLLFEYTLPSLAAYCFLSVRDYVKGSNGALNWPFLDVPVVFF
jgi:hypothetical protein